jgi:tRNA(Ile)-lysidine synthase
MRIAVASSGGADSVALLRALLEKRGALGLVVSVVHMNHGIRGAESDGDEGFVAELAAAFQLPFEVRRVDTPGNAHRHKEGLEESARKLRYAWFWELLAAGAADAVLTAHTLGDQSETVLHRLIRGAWTEGLGGIHPILRPPPGQSGVILRPFLATSREEIEGWLRSIGQTWRDDASNADMAFTRNRIRHQLLPVLAEYNPQIRQQLAQLATLARDEEAFWQVELARVLPSLLLSGKAVRGGGRATDTLAGGDSLAIEIERLRSLHPALRRRVLRAASAKLGSALNFGETERLLAMCGLGEDGAAARAGLKLQLAIGLVAERTPRELRLRHEREARSKGDLPVSEYTLPIPGSVDAVDFGLRLEATVGKPPEASLPDARFRASRPGDRVTLRHSRSALKIKEALLRMRLAPETPQPVLEWQGEIVWMPGVALESRAGREAVLSVNASLLDSGGQA